mgnify:CR=1 FL=1
MRRRIPTRNPKRAAREFVRCYESQARKQWVCSLPCIVTVCQRQSENAHVGKKGAGAGRKADSDQIASLCRYHHTQLHQYGPEWFARAYGWTQEALDNVAATTEAAWRRECGE